MDILLPPMLASVVLLLGWMSDRNITGGRPLTAHMKKVLFYGSFFVLGVGYFIIWQDQLGSLVDWHPLWIVLIVLWGLFLAYWGWGQSRQKQSNSPENQQNLVQTQLAESLPVVGLLVCLVGSVIEWEFILEGQGKWFIGLLWIVGVGVAWLLAGRNRRAAVIVALRGVVALLVVGAIAQRTPPALVAAGIFGLGLVLLETLWHGEPSDRSN